MRNRCIIVLTMMLALLAFGCTIPVTSPQSSSATSATPRISRHWKAPPVLIELTEYPGLSTDIFLTVPRLVLYADGRIITSRRSSDAQSIILYQARLPLTSVCSLLRQIESDGFFDFNPNEYKPPRVTDMDTFYITVNAWRTQRVSAYALHIAVGAGSSVSKLDAYVPPGLANTYKRLWDYQPPSITIYQPERIALLIAGPVKATVDAPFWQIPNLTLAELVKRGSGRWNAVILEGEQATQVLSVFGNNWQGRIFNEDGQWYGLNLSPLVPLQTWLRNNDFLPQPNSYPDTPTIEMKCDNE